MNKLKIFENKDFGVIRTVEVNNEAWFVGKDVAEALGYSNSRDAIKRHVDEEDKGVAKHDTLGGNQDLAVINESGVYALIFSSKLEKAKEFKHWVTSEVLPAIRKHGVYATKELLDNPDLLIDALKELKSEREARKQLEETVAVDKQVIAELQPKASYYDAILQNKSVLAISVIAKDYGLSGRRLNEILHELKIQYKQGDIWLLYQKYAEQGYTQTKTHIIDADKSSVSMYWTQKGRLFLYDTLKSKLGLIPLIERNETGKGA